MPEKKKIHALIEEKLDMAYAMYVMAIEYSVTELQLEAMQFMQAVLNTSSDTETLRLMEIRQRTKKYNPFFIPGLAPKAIGIDKIDIAEIEANKDIEDKKAHINLCN